MQAVTGYFAPLVAREVAPYFWGSTAGFFVLAALLDKVLEIPALQAKFPHGFQAESVAHIRGRILGMLFAVGATLSVTYGLWNTQLTWDDVTGYDPVAQRIAAMTAGWFVYDVYICIQEGWGAAFIGHGVGGLLVYIGALQPVYHLMGMACLLYEASTPFLHWRSWLITNKMTDKVAFQVANVLFALVFLGVRIVIGLPMCITWWVQMYQLVQAGQLPVPVVSALVFGVNVFMNGLNIMWAQKIVAGIIEHAGGGKKVKDA